MNIMKQIADALGVEIGEVFRLARLQISHTLYKITDKDFLKSEDHGNTWKEEPGIMFLAMCKGDWTITTDTKLLPEHKKLIEEYKILTEISQKINRELITQRSLGKDFNDAHVKELRLTFKSIIAHKHQVFTQLKEQGITIPDLE